MRWLVVGLLALILTSSGPAIGAQSGGPASLSGLDYILDFYVRDGLVYYRALKAGRSRLDAYVGSLGSASIESSTKQEQLAFWLNAYNALVLRTVIDAYPIGSRSREFPPKSIRQIPGAFERLQRRVAGRMVTLDDIEKTILPAFGDPRAYLALGRGAMGSGRLRSEAFTGSSLEQQLSEVAAECIDRAQCLEIDRSANRIGISAIFSWREQDFAAAYSDKAAPVFSERSPIERAVLAFIEPKLLGSEREFLARNEFKIEYLPFDWTLNDLTGRGGQ